MFSIIDYLEEQAGSSTARAYGEKFANAIRGLMEFPNMGMPKPDLGPNTRTILIYPYVLIYELTETENGLVILRVLHGKREITEKLNKS